MNEDFSKAIINFNWFEKCGQPFDHSVAFPVKQVSSWPEAIEQCSSSIWEDITLEARNHLTEFLHKHHPDAYANWNSITKKAKENFVLPLVENQWQPFAERHGLDKIFIDSVSWDLLAAVMEHEYQDLPGCPRFFLDLLRIYQLGHFPCGWDGEWPDGSLLAW